MNKERKNLKESRGLFGQEPKRKEKVIKRKKKQT